MLQKVSGAHGEVNKVALPYEKQIGMLLCELANIHKLSGCKGENTDNDSDIYVQCREIKLALDYLKEKQQRVLAQWKKTGEQDRIRLLLPVIDGVDEMTSLARNSGCEAVGEYIESEIMSELLDMLDLPE